MAVLESHSLDWRLDIAPSTLLGGIGLDDDGGIIGLIAKALDLDGGSDVTRLFLPGSESNNAKGVVDISGPVLSLIRGDIIRLLSLAGIDGNDVGGVLANL